MRQRLSGRNPVQPRTESGLTPKLTDGFVHFCEHLLRYVIGFVTIAQQPEGQVVNPALVGIHKPAEGRFAARFQVDK
jgi:hypothetical protein